MKTFGVASIAAAALSGALFTTSVTAADLPSVVIKVHDSSYLLPDCRLLTLLGLSLLL